MRTRLFFVALLIATSAVAITAGPAAASCSFASNVLSITVPEDGTVTVVRGAANAILVDGVGCGGATVVNTLRIETAATDGSATLVIDLSGGPFVPGFGDEPGTASDEVEWNVNLSAATRRTVVVQGSSGIDTIGYAGRTVPPGTTINLAAEVSGSLGEDQDVVAFGGEDMVFLGGGGNDVVTQAAIAGAIPMYFELVADGGPGADDIVGGDQGDELAGGSGSDDLEGGGDPDHFYPQSGNDTMTDAGGDGGDHVHFTAPDGGQVGTGGINVDLGAGTASGTGHGTDSLDDIEYVSGTPLNDTLRGDAGHNEFFGDAGADRMIGLGDEDSFSGELGADVYSGGKGVDTALLFPGVDVHVDLAITAGQATGEGKDTFGGIENVITGEGDDTLLGDAGPNGLSPGGGVDEVDGRGGDDSLTGSTGFFDSARRRSPVAAGSTRSPTSVTGSPSRWPSSTRRSREPTATACWTWSRTSAAPARTTC